MFQVIRFLSPRILGNNKWIGLRERLQENPWYFMAHIHGFSIIIFP